MTRRNRGNALPSLLILIALILGVGAWNYHKNLALDEQEYRPFRGHSDEALHQLIDAYENERDRDKKAYLEVAGRRASAKTKPMLDEQVAEFERVQSHGLRTRQLRNAVAGHQASLKELKKEASRRTLDADNCRRILRLATTF